MDLQQLLRPITGIGVPLVVLDLIVHVQFLQQPQDTKGTRKFKVVYNDRSHHCLLFTDAKRLDVCKRTRTAHVLRREHGI